MYIGRKSLLCFKITWPPLSLQLADHRNNVAILSTFTVSSAEEHMSTCLCSSTEPDGLTREEGEPCSTRDAVAILALAITVYPDSIARCD